LPVRVPVHRRSDDIPWHPEASKRSWRVAILQRIVDRTLANHRSAGGDKPKPSKRVVPLNPMKIPSKNPQALSRPSVSTEEFYIGVTRRRGGYPRHTENGGKWLIFAPMSEVDELWDKIREATEDGQLGGSAKVATAKPNTLAIHNDRRSFVCTHTTTLMRQT
jgi:hypothetical protein